VRGCPTFQNKQQQWQSLIINIAIPKNKFNGTYYTMVPMRVSSVIDILPYEARVAVMSHVAFQCSLDVNNLYTIRLPSKYARYNVMAGADLADANLSEVEELRANKLTTTGWLYGRRPLVYDPEKLTDAIFFFECESALNTDCLVHAVNYALRYPFFVSRDQVLRLMGKRLKESPSLVANRKSLGGVPPSAFVDFCVIDGQSLSLRLVETFKVEEGQGSNTLRAFVISRMLERPQFSELIVVGSAQGAVVPYTHACTFVAINQGDKPHLAYCDC
jgi:hypothetical protein